MPAIVLATLNAKWIHASFGLRCLYASLGELREQTVLIEGTIHERPLDLVERILAERPRIVGLGVYVWNARETELVVSALRRVAPEVRIVLGGPEVSHEVEGQALCRLADHVVLGEGELVFAELCRSLLGGAETPERILRAPPPELARLPSPYRYYDEQDLAHRVVYVEASRGCPYVCEFCLSALDEKVRAFPLAPFLDEMELLLERGLASFKFVDRTFNLSLATSSAILEFFLERWREGLFLHFELIPDRLPERLLALLARFPPGAVQLEVGIQSFDAATLERIARRQDLQLVERNLRRLREETGVHLHTDLIAGLPGEDLGSFARGFDRLMALRPHEIQVGILKRLRGAPIARHDAAAGMRYAAHPPYEVLATGAVSFTEMQALRRFARTFDLVHNRGNFPRTFALLLGAGSAYAGVLALSEWLHARGLSLQAIALDRLAQALYEHALERGLAPETVGAALLADYAGARPGYWPSFLAAHVAPGARRSKSPPADGGAAERQRRARHAP